MDQSRRDFRVTFPQLGEPEPPQSFGEEPDRSGQKCVNCNAYVIRVGPLGPESMCCAGPAVPFVMGVRQSKVVNPKTGQPDQYPWVVAFWPPTEEHLWCRDWEWIEKPRRGKNK